jgi:hypothetical protein
MESKDYASWEEERRRRRTERKARREERRQERHVDDESWEDRKERVLHTRVSEKLAEDIRKAADDLRVPVSNLVRNVLEDAFSVVEAVTGEVGDLIEDVVVEADRAREVFSRHGRRGVRRARRFVEEELETPREEAAELPEFPDVIGWQPMILNGERVCDGCAHALSRGKRAFVGLTSSGVSNTYLCSRCAKAVQS